MSAKSEVCIKLRQIPTYFVKTHGAVVEWLSLLHNFIQLSLNLGSAQVQTLVTACRRFAMVMISDNDPGWK